MSASSIPPPLSPVFCGHVATTHDALILFEACLIGRLNHVARRPFDRERPELIKSGNVFIFEQHSSGMKRWTDGLPWSPSRVLGDFLVYRELKQPLPPGRRRAPRKVEIAQSDIERMSSAPEGTSYESTRALANSNVQSQSNTQTKDRLRNLVGSLVDSYEFKKEGLVKKTISVTIGGIAHHLIAYYAISDILDNKFGTPSGHSELQFISPRQALLTNQGFRPTPDQSIPIPSKEHFMLQDLPHTTAIPQHIHCSAIPKLIPNPVAYSNYFSPEYGYEYSPADVPDRSNSLVTPSASFLYDPSIASFYQANSEHQASIDQGFSSSSVASSATDNWGVSHALMDTKYVPETSSTWSYH